MPAFAAFCLLAALCFEAFELAEFLLAWLAFESELAWLAAFGFFAGLLLALAAAGGGGGGRLLALFPLFPDVRGGGGLLLALFP